MMYNWWKVFQRPDVLVLDTGLQYTNTPYTIHHYCCIYNSQIMHYAHTRNIYVLWQPIEKCVADELCKEKTQ